MVYRLACEAPDLFAAVAPLAAVVANSGMSVLWHQDHYDCPAPETPLPVLHIHGRVDIAVPYRGTPLFGFPGLEASLALTLFNNGSS